MNDYMVELVPLIIIMGLFMGVVLGTIVKSMRAINVKTKRRAFLVFLMLPIITLLLIGVILAILYLKFYQ